MNAMARFVFLSCLCVSAVVLAGCPKPELAVAPTSHDFGETGTQWQFNVDNTGAIAASLTGKRKPATAG